MKSRTTLAVTLAVGLLAAAWLCSRTIGTRRDAPLPGPAAAERSADRPAVERPGSRTDRDQLPRVTVVSANVAGAIELTYTSTRGARATRNTRSGEPVELPERGDYLVRVRPTGRRPTYFIIGVAQENVELALLETATVQVRIRGADGPRAGVPVQLLPGTIPGAGAHAWESLAATEHDVRARAVEQLEAALGGDAGRRELRALFERHHRRAMARGAGPTGVFARLEEMGPDRGSTDDTGTFAWRGLRPGVPYRWASRSIPATGMEPPHELAVPRGQPHPVDFGQRVPEGLSGLFTPGPGEEVRIEVDVSGLAALRGRLAAFDPGAGAVRLRHEVPIAGGAQDAPLGWIQAAQTTPNDDGSFLFEGLEPGRVRVSAMWEPQAWTYHYAGRELELRAGTEHDLGLLSPLGEGALELLVRVVDGRGQERPEALLTPLASCEVLLAPAGGAARGDPVLEQFTPRLGTPVLVRGLGVGRYALTVALDGMDPHTFGRRPLLADGFVLNGESMHVAQVDVPAERLVVDFVALESGRLEVRVPFPDPPGGGALGAGVAVANSGACHELSLRWDHERGSAIASVALPAGTYQVTGGIAAMAGAEPGLWFDDEVEVLSGAGALTLCTPATVPAARVYGRIDKPRGLRPMGLRAGPVSTTTRCGQWLSMPLVDDGTYALPFLPPATQIRVYGCSKPFTTGAAGTSRQVDLVLDE
ncbi:MAG: hypothetical protein GY711_09115 [bacterium]|nr:hypothetical protein [bacterium]